MNNPAAMPSGTECNKLSMPVPANPMPALAKKQIKAARQKRQYCVNRVQALLGANAQGRFYYARG